MLVVVRFNSRVEKMGEPSQHPRTTTHRIRANQGHSMTVVDARQLLVLITDPTEVQERREVPISFSDYDIVPKYIFLHLFSIQAVCDISGILNTGLDREVRISNSGTLTVHGVAEHFIFKRKRLLSIP